MIDITLGVPEDSDDYQQSEDTSLLDTLVDLNSKLEDAVESISTLVSAIDNLNSSLGREINNT